jgi:hypothetical protein
LESEEAIFASERVTQIGRPSGMKATITETTLIYWDLVSFGTACTQSGSYSPGAEEC